MLEPKDFDKVADRFRAAAREFPYFPVVFTEPGGVSGIQERRPGGLKIWVPGVPGEEVREAIQKLKQLLQDASPILRGCGVDCTLEGGGDVTGKLSVGQWIRFVAYKIGPVPKGPWVRSRPSASVEWEEIPGNVFALSALTIDSLKFDFSTPAKEKAPPAPRAPDKRVYALALAYRQMAAEGSVNVSAISEQIAVEKSTLYRWPEFRNLLAVCRDYHNRAPSSQRPGGRGKRRRGGSMAPVKRVPKTIQPRGH